MLIRIGSIDDLKLLWGEKSSPTKTYFMEGIEKGNIEFWTIENEIDNLLIGELYIFWDSEDKDEANGKDRAYLCAFRTDSKFRGLGLGKALMNRVLERIVENGFCEATIGVDNDNADRLSKMYKSWGFSELVKLQNVDNHYIDANNGVTYYDFPYALYLKKLKLEFKIIEEHKSNNQAPLIIKRGARVKVGKRSDELCEHLSDMEG